MQQYNQHWNVTLPWVLATVAGVVIGILSILTFVSGLALTGTSTVLVGIIGGAALGGGVGIAQWLVLRRYVRSAIWWIVVSVIGGMLGVALGLLLSDALSPLISALLGEAGQVRPTRPGVLLSRALAAAVAGACVGLVLGGAQWLVLRRHVQSALWWIVVSWLGWMTSLSVGAGMVDLVGVLGSLLVVGVVSGVAMGWLLAQFVSGHAAPSPRAGTT
jgi:hypothetical protein